ncbi:MAG: helix-turn-helix domain-containing protein [Eubacteriales bacterium]|nr:helix-turn-helix domain-containing protein [Eubacteriales bacterium]
MISNNTLKVTLEGIKMIAKVELALFNPDGTKIISTDVISGKDEARAQDFALSDADSQSFGETYFIKVRDKGSLVYMLSAKGTGDETLTYLRLAAFQLQTMINSDKDRFDKDNFLKNVILDNLLYVDILDRARKFHIENEQKRIVFLIEIKDDSDNTVIDILRPLYGEGAGGFLFKTDERHIVYVRNLEDGDGEEEFLQTARGLLDIVNTEGMQRSNISYGNPVTELKDLSRSYKEAGLAMEVGRIFRGEDYITAYAKLGIGRLIYQLPVTLCRMFLNEIFPDTKPEDLDEETLQTIKQFFTDSLNISEASRNLYIHRNTLVYRLDKMQKTLGLNIRNFEDAMTLKIALMVDEYLRYVEKDFN